MASIHKLSSVVPLNEFDIFGIPPTQSTVEQDILTEHRPIAALDSKSYIEFIFSSAQDEYIRLDKTWLYLRLRVNISKPLNVTVAETDWAKVSTVNNLLNSIFKQVDLSIGDRNITPQHQTYSYKTDFEYRLGKSKDAKESFLSSGFWFEEWDKEPEEINAARSKLIKADASPFENGKEFDLMGRIHLSMFEQNKALLGGCNLKLRLLPNTPDFYMMCDSTVRISSVEFLNTCLYVHRSKISKPVLAGHLKGLELGNARYQVRESFVVPVTINKGILDTIVDNVWNGQLPKRAFVAFVDHAAFNGSTILNPYNYQHFDLMHLSFYLNGIQYPEKAFTPDFDKNLYIREYLSLFEATNQDNVDSCITIKRSQFPNGNNIFAVNFNPDLSTGCCSTGYVNPLKYGSLRLQIRFKKALPKTITALVYLDYDTILEIDKENKPITYLY